MSVLMASMRSVFFSRHGGHLDKVSKSKCEMEIVVVICQVPTLNSKADSSTFSSLFFLAYSEIRREWRKQFN